MADNFVRNRDLGNAVLQRGKAGSTMHQRSKFDMTTNNYSSDAIQSGVKAALPFEKVALRPHESVLSNQAKQR